MAHQFFFRLLQVFQLCSALPHALRQGLASCDGIESVDRRAKFPPRKTSLEVLCLQRKVQYMSDRKCA